MFLRWLFVFAATILVAACGNSRGARSTTFPEPTPYCVSCPGTGYHCEHNPETCVPDKTSTTKPK